MLTNLSYQYDLQAVSIKTSSFLNTFPTLGPTLALHLPFKENRFIVESFVWKGFKQHYQADIQHFLPNLISIGQGNAIKSALGFRSAKTQPLFLEQYLDDKIESHFSTENIQRHQIGEMGNLFGTHKQMTLQLFIITLLSLVQSDFKKLVFSATPQVKAMFDKFKVNMQHISSANPEKIGSQLQHWGSYYDTTPEIFAVDIEAITSIIKNSKRLSLIATKFSQDIDRISSSLVK